MTRVSAGLLNKSEKTPQGMVPFALGFRPFFLMAGVAAVVLMALWVLLMMGVLSAPAYYGPLLWHGHEMIFGFTTAVVAGFLLTAIKNWTGVQTLHGWPLAVLAGLWLLGRLLPWFAVPPLVIAAVDLLFWPLLAAGIAHPLIVSANRNNVFFVLLVLAGGVGNLLIHLELAGVSWGNSWLGLLLGVFMILQLLVVMGGRVIGFFIERGLPQARPSKSRPWLERAVLMSMPLWLLFEMLPIPSSIMAVILLSIAVLHGLRIAGWYQPGVFRVSLLWVLLLGYGWIVAGFVLLALAELGLVSSLLALHAWLAGGVGVMTLGMMARVSLGHSGREMKVPASITLAFALVMAAALVRVLLAAILPSFYDTLVYLSAALWVAAFGLFCGYYVPILLQPRVDGQPG